MHCVRSVVYVVHQSAGAALDDGLDVNRVGVGGVEFVL